MLAPWSARGSRPGILLTVVSDCTVPSFQAEQSEPGIEVVLHSTAAAFVLNSPIFAPAPRIRQLTNEQDASIITAPAVFMYRSFSSALHMLACRYMVQKVLPDSCNRVQHVRREGGRPSNAPARTLVALEKWYKLSDVDVLTVCAPDEPEPSSPPRTPNNDSKVGGRYLQPGSGAPSHGGCALCGDRWVPHITMHKGSTRSNVPAHIM